MKTKKLENKSYIKIFIIGGFLLFPIIFFTKSIFLAALVNGKTITRYSVVKELEKQNGKRILDSLISRELILQEAKKKGIEIKQAEIDKEIKKIEESTTKQGQSLDQLLELQGMTRNDLKNQMQVQLTVEKLLANKIKVSDKEIDEYIKKSDTGEEGSAQKPLSRDEARNQLRQQKLQKEATAWIEQLKKNAKISIFVNY